MMQLQHSVQATDVLVRYCTLHKHGTVIFGAYNLSDHVHKRQMSTLGEKAVFKATCYTCLLIGVILYLQIVL